MFSTCMFTLNTSITMQALTAGTADGKSAWLRSHSCCVLAVYFALHNLAISPYTALQLWKLVFKICNWSLLFIHNSTSIVSNPGSTGSLFKTLWAHVAKVLVQMCTVLYNWLYCTVTSALLVFSDITLQLSLAKPGVHCLIADIQLVSNIAATVVLNKSTLLQIVNVVNANAGYAALLDRSWSQLKLKQYVDCRWVN